MNEVEEKGQHIDVPVWKLKKGDRVPRSSLDRTKSDTLIVHRHTKLGRGRTIEFEDQHENLVRYTVSNENHRVKVWRPSSPSART